ncbi:hypothetical protein GC175_14225 [bacterium]|nr:hypothetical protein [bacterium]
MTPTPLSLSRGVIALCIRQIAPTELIVQVSVQAMSLRLLFLGAFQVVHNDTPIASFRSVNIQALLTYLAMESDRPHPRDALIQLFWPDEPADVARHNLSQSLYLLRKAVDADKQGSPRLLVTRQTIQFNPASDYALDVADFLAALDAGHLADAVALYRGAFLDGIYTGSVLFEEWLFHQRERLQRRMLTALGELAQQHLEQGDFEETVRYIQRQLVLMPWREEAHRQLMRVLVQNGERETALAQYEICRRVLMDELGVEPDAETTALYDQIRLGPQSLTRSAGAPSFSSPIRDWGGAPYTTTLHGRQAELNRLRSWLVGDGCRLVGVLGMGGIGKTALTVRLAQEVADGFDGVIWRSLINSPPPTEILRTWLQILSGEHLVELPTSVDAQFDLLFDYLRRQRTLLILDNVESVLEDRERSGAYRPGYDLYDTLLQRFGAVDHRSCLILTSRERPRGLERLEREMPWVRWLDLEGLDRAAGEAILADQGVTIHGDKEADLVGRYSGNPLALRLVAEVVQDLFLGDVGAFLSEETPLFDDIRDVLAQQFARLSALEQEVLLWLAIEREPISLSSLEKNLLNPVQRGNLLAAIRSLQRRSLLEGTHNRFGLQNVVMEYATSYLVESICQEIEACRPHDLRRFALLKTNAREYVRRSQERIFLAPVSERLLTRMGRARLERDVQSLLARLRAEAPLAPGYTAGNLLNLLLHLESDLRGYDFSHLAVWQADLRNREVFGVDFSGADLTGSVFSDTFAYIPTLAWHPNGHLLAAGTMAGEIRLWREEDDQPAGTFVGHAGPVYGVAFTPDGQTLVSGGEDGIVRLWDVNNGTLRHELHRQAGQSPTVTRSAIWDIAVDATGTLAGSGSEDGSVSLWYLRQDIVAEQSALHSVLAMDGWVRAVAFSPDGKILAAGDDSGIVRLWDPASGERLCDLQDHSSGIWSITFSADGALLAGSSLDGTIRIWDLQRQTLLHTLSEHGAWVRSVAFHPSADLLASGGSDHMVRLWDVKNGELRRTLPGHESRVWAVAFHPKGHRLASSGPDQTVRLWDVASGQLHHTLIGRTARVWAVAFSPDGVTAAGGGEDDTVRLWDVAAMQRQEAMSVHSGLRQSLRDHTNWIFCLAFDNRGERLASVSGDLTVRLWDVATGKCLHVLREHHNRICSVAFSPDGRRVLSGGEDGKLCLWDVHSSRQIWRAQANFIFSVLFHPTEPIVASAGADGVISLWDAESGRQLRTLARLPDHAYAIAVSPDGNLLVGSCGDKHIRVWSFSSGQVIHVFPTQSAWVRAVAYHPQGTLVAAADGASVHLLDVAGGTIQQTLNGHTAPVMSIAFSPSSAHLLTGSFDGTLRLWDVQTGATLASVKPPGPYAGVQISGATGLTSSQQAALRTLGAKVL